VKAPFCEVTILFSPIADNQMLGDKLIKTGAKLASRRECSTFWRSLGDNSLGWPKDCCDLGEILTLWGFKCAGESLLGVNGKSRVNPVQKTVSFPFSLARPGDNIYD
jgi:hypothetical protein